MFSTGYPKPAQANSQTAERRRGSGKRGRGCRWLEVEPLETRLAPAVHTWTGLGTTNNWSDAGNWIEGTPAGDPSATLILPAAPRQTNTNDLADVTIHSMTFASNYTINGMAISLNTSITVDANV